MSFDGCDILYVHGYYAMLVADVHGHAKEFSLCERRAYGKMRHLKKDYLVLYNRRSSQAE